MKLALFAVALVPFVTSAVVRVEDPAPKPKGEKVEKKEPVYDESAIGSDQIAAALAKAKKENRRVLVQWGANWCGWCTLLAQLEKSNAEISRKLLYEYDLVKIDIGTWEKPKHADLAEKYGAELKKHGVPYLTVLDADGKVIANQDTGALELEDKTKPAHDPQKVLEFLTKNQAAALDAQKTLDAAIAQAAKDHKRVFLHFGAPWCGWCHRLEDWLAKPEIANVLAKDFVEVKIDSDRHVGGQEMLTRMSNGKNGGIPWFVFLDERGQPLIDSIGPNGKNIGFPADPPEIEHFQTMLTKARVKITPDEIASLAASLVPKKDAK